MARRAHSREPTIGQLEIRPLTASIGAEITGVDLRELDHESATAIEEALHRHLVLFFRNQPLEPAEHVRFARWFGPVAPHPFAKPHPDQPELTVLAQSTPETDGTNSWHTDSTFMPCPPLGSILQAVELPAVGGDTCWASMYAALDALSDSLRQYLRGLTAEHDITEPLRWSIGGGHSVSADLETLQERWPPFVHPVVRRHPATGRECLYVNRNFTTRIRELNGDESNTLLQFLFQHVARPDFQVRFRWEHASIAFWDNRCTQHYAVPDYSGQRRVMHRVMIEGDQPVGPAMDESQLSGGSPSRRSAP